MSTVGRPLTEEELSALAEVCYRSFEFRQDIHCEDTSGFGLSLDNGAVREVYLYKYSPPGDEQTFPGALPGSVSWDDTLSDITGKLGEPECVDSIIQYNLHYSSDGLDVEYSVEASHDPTSRLNKITIRAMTDRPATCHLASG